MFTIVLATALVAAIVYLVGSVHEQKTRSSRRTRDPFEAPSEAKVPQVQCFLYYPDHGFQYDRVRFAGIDEADWLTLREAVATHWRNLPRLTDLLNAGMPMRLPRNSVLALTAEMEDRRNSRLIDESASLAYADLLMVLQQGTSQRNAALFFEVIPGERCETAIVYRPDVDVLEQVEAMNVGLDPREVA